MSIGPVFFPEIEDFSVLKMIDDLVHEFFGRDIDDLDRGVGGQGGVADGVHQVRFSQARTRRRYRAGCRILAGFLDTAIEAAWAN